MEIHNYAYGVKFRNPAAGTYMAVNTFFPLNTARFTYYSNLSFLVSDPGHYQTDITFVRADVTSLKSNGAVVALPGTDDALFDLVSSFLFSGQEPITGGLIPFTGASYILQAGDNGKTFLATEPPSAKTFTIPVGLPTGLEASVIKMYATSAITFVGSGGMVLTGLDLLLDKLGSRMDILITGPTTAVCINIGG